MTWTIVIHGGAGVKKTKDVEEEKEAIYAALRECVMVGAKMLEQGFNCVDACEASVKALEDCPFFNAGKGACCNIDGKFELDAGIMEGQTLKSGACTLIKTTKNPISLARLVMEATQHRLIGGDAADSFAEKNGLGIVSNDYFSTDRAISKWSKWKAISGDTVGCACLDSQSNLCVGNSTGGRFGKMAGRIGDSPLMNCGFYSNADVALVSTGIGEEIIKYAACKEVTNLMKYEKKDLRQSMKTLVHETMPIDTVGLIGLTKDGNWCWDYNTEGMFRASMTHTGMLTLGIWEEEIQIQIDIN